MGLNLMEMFVKIGAKDEASKVIQGVSNLAKASAAVIGSAAVGVAALAKQAVASYADYEQLVGGVETLFGESSNAVMEYANNAYKTAGLSANAYMETVTSFSASLLQSLGGDTAKATEYANTAITDMSDNANKMGTSMESIQNAYQGFAKQNYTMLDNLKLGYGGTKEEMVRLVEDAEKLNDTFRATRDENGKVAMTYAEIVDAIHIVQDNLGITGTTAKEASSTISGSANAMKSAWDNFLVGLADDTQDFDSLVSNLVDSTETFAGNIMPRVQTALNGIITGISKLAPIIAEKLPEMLNEAVPALFEAAVGLVSALGNALIENAPMLLETGISLVQSLVQGMAENAETATDSILELVAQLAVILTSPDTLTPLLTGALEIIVAIANGIVDALPELIPACSEIITNIVQVLGDYIPELVDASIEIVVAIANGIIDNLPEIVNASMQITATITSEIVGLVSTALSWGTDLISNFVSGITSGIGRVKDAIVGIAKTVRENIGFSEPEEGPLSNFHTYAPDMIDLFTEGIEQNGYKIKSAFDSVLSPIKGGTEIAGNFTMDGTNAPSRGSGGLSGATININISSDVIDSDYGAQRFAEKVSEALHDLQMRESLAVGGAW